MQFYQSEAAYVKFDYNIPRGASIGVYARRNALPTHTQYHILEVLSGFKARTTRASHVSHLEFRLAFRIFMGVCVNLAFDEKRSYSLHGARSLVLVLIQ